MSIAASAQAEPTALERATAEALFQQGVELTLAEKFVEACPKFEASLEVDRAIGTMLRLADCYDRAGKSASAWGLFEEVAALAQRSGDDTRRDIARARSEDLQKRLSLVQIVLPRSLVDADPVVQIGRVRVPRAALDAPLPIDPGPTEIGVSARGRVSWKSERAVPQGPTLTKVEVPELAPLPSSTPEPRPRPSASHPPAEEPSMPTWSYVLGATGLIGLAVGGYLAYRADAKNDDSLAECRPEDSNACTPSGVRSRNEARDLANGATISFAAGGVALGAAAAIAIWGGDGQSAASTTSALQAQPFLTGAYRGVAIRGAF